MSQLSVLLISDDPDFAQTLMARWQGERSVPTFLLMGTAVWSNSLVSACDLALIGPSEPSAIIPILKSLDAANRPALCVTRDSGNALRSACPRAMLLREHEGWVDVLVLLAAEVARRLEACARARRAEQLLAQTEPNATLGRYLLEMRHALNNALTSVLGNAELLLLEPGSLSAGARDQLSTIHSMALRIHEILQRFSSMELELKFYAKPAPPEMHPVTSLSSPVITAVPEGTLS